MSDITEIFLGGGGEGYTTPQTLYNNLVSDFVDEVELWCCAAILSETVMPK